MDLDETLTDTEPVPGSESRLELVLQPIYFTASELELELMIGIAPKMYFNLQFMST